MMMLMISRVLLQGHELSTLKQVIERIVVAQDDDVSVLAGAMFVLYKYEFACLVQQGCARGCVSLQNDVDVDGAKCRGTGLPWMTTTEHVWLGLLTLFVNCFFSPDRAQVCITTVSHVHALLSMFAYAYVWHFLCMT